MIISIPDVDLSSMSLEEVKEHAGLVAKAENELRAYAIKIQSRVIVLVRESWGEIKYVAHKPKPKALGNIEDEYSIEDFR